MFEYRVNQNGEVIITGYKGNVTEVVIPSEIEGMPVTSIGMYAFLAHSRLTSVTIPDSVKSIGDAAFEGCRSLKSVEIPDSVTSVGDYAFWDCSSLTDINVDSNNANYSSSTDGVLFNKDKTKLICYPIGKTNTSYTIPNSVTSIGYAAFEGCIGLTSVEIPDSVTSIGDAAFYGCRSLTSVTLPDSLTSIEYSVFEGCRSLTYLKIPESVTDIGKRAFYGCRRLTIVMIPESLTSIMKRAFCGCYNLEEIYYTGTEEQWEKIKIGRYSRALHKARKHFKNA